MPTTIAVLKSSGRGMDQMANKFAQRAKLEMTA